ncbi:hypothetical protein HYC85_008303 [Camellia sinensis]|uniref:CRAL-TRIO domain-containing protein n=1 Tax=Camellia sinensis TaxID=4442 RepID=A0A7J7HSU6_CAMSI|nr:hypothetical protein HYC85_008303 [Camellia sinensis]
MSADSKKSTSNGGENPLISEEQQEKIDEVRRLVGPLPDKLSIYCSDASISRYLKARNWNVKKATKMLKDTLKWRLEYKPEEIRWDEVAREAETGKIYRSKYADKHGRPVLVMRPSCQNSKSTKAQIRYLVYCLENAIMNLPQHQEEMVWLIDFHGYNLSNISVMSTRETAHVLQDYYPERLGVAILYNPPKFFEPFWTIEEDRRQRDNERGRETATETETASEKKKKKTKEEEEEDRRTKKKKKNEEEEANVYLR